MAICQKRCKIGGKLLLITSRKSYISFRLVPKLVTLNDLERRNGHYFALFQRIWVASGVHCVKVHVRYLISWWVLVKSNSNKKASICWQDFEMFPYCSTLVPIWAMLCQFQYWDQFKMQDLCLFTWQCLPILFCTALPLVKPRPPTATSIPAILKSLQDEWVMTSCSVQFVILNLCCFTVVASTFNTVYVWDNVITRCSVYLTSSIDQRVKMWVCSGRLWKVK